MGALGIGWSAGLNCPPPDGRGQGVETVPMAVTGPAVMRPMGLVVSSAVEAGMEPWAVGSGAAEGSLAGVSGAEMVPA